MISEIKTGAQATRPGNRHTPQETFNMNTVHTILDTARNLWDSFAFRVIALGLIIAAVPAAFLLHVAENLSR